ARHDVLLGGVDCPGEGFHPGFHPIRPSPRPPPRRLHHFVCHPAKEESIGLRDVLGRVAMQVFVRDPLTMIAAAVQCDVDGIPKGSHYVRVPLQSAVAIAIVSFTVTAPFSLVWLSFGRPARERRNAAPGTCLVASHYTRRS